MIDISQPWPRLLVTEVSDIESEFEARLTDSSSLAFRVALGVLRHREDAEDVAQEAFARAFRSFRQLRDRDAFRAWLVRTTWRLSLDHVRGQKRRITREQVALETAPRTSGEELAIEAERSRRLWEAIDRLPETLRLTIVLASIEGHSMKDIAVLTEAPEGTVKSRVFDAKRLLREMLT